MNPGVAPEATDSEKREEPDHARSRIRGLILLAVNLAAAVALLLWAVRLIRTGVERAFLSQIRGHLRRMARNRASAAAGGTAAAMLLQSATAVALISGGFVASGLLPPLAGLALMLGAELGSALMTLVLSLPVEAVTPFLLLFGAMFFLRGKRRAVKQTGRILLGLGLVFVALGMIGTATEPLRDSPAMGAVGGFLASDPLSGVALGMVFAFAIHSSLAAVLTFAGFAAGGALPVEAGMALVIGANLGGGLIPVMLTLSAPVEVRRMALANLLLRGGVALIFLAALALGVPGAAVTSFGAEQWLVATHVAVNASTLGIGLPLLAQALRLAGFLVPDQPARATERLSALDPAALPRPRRALSCAQRELLHMGEALQAMLLPALGLFQDWSEESAALIARHEERVDRMHFETKLYVARLKDSAMSEEETQRATEIVAMSNSLEEAGDRIATTLVPLARRLNQEGLAFSEDSWRDLSGFHDHVVTNSQLALEVLLSGDVEAARQLVAEKDSIREEEQALQARHLHRLRDRDMASVETTNIHQEVLRALKQVNAAITYVAYPIARETGDLLETRLARPVADRAGS